MDYDNHALTIGSTGSLFNKNSQTAKFFKVAFGEEFGTSTTSSVVSYSGVGNATGSAAFTGSIPYYYLMNLLLTLLFIYGIYYLYLGLLQQQILFLH